MDARNFFLKRNFCTEVCHCKQTSCAQSVDHILKNVVSSKTTVFECAQKSLIFDIGRHFDIKWFKDNEDNSQLATTTINIFELYYGSYRSANPEGSIDAVNNLLKSLTILTLDSKSAQEAGKQLARLTSEGNIIDFKDILIGAIALKSDYSLKTNNRKDFERIDGLKLI